MNVSRSPATGRMRITGHFPKPEAKVRCNIPKKPECQKKIRHVHPFTERCFLLSAKEELAPNQIAYPFFSYKNISRSKSVSVHTLDETARMNRMQEQLFIYPTYFKIKNHTSSVFLAIPFFK